MYGKFSILHSPFSNLSSTFASDFKNRLLNQASPQQKTSSLHPVRSDFVT